MKPVLITVAPNGARRGKADHPALPMTLPEIIAESRACHAAGAALLHLHVRDTAGRHSLDAGLYGEALAALAAEIPGLLVQITTEAAGRYDPAAQFECLRAVRPACASVAVREIAADADIAARFYHLAADIGTLVQHILYDLQDLAQLCRWWADGTVPPGPRTVLFVLGRYADAQQGHPRDLLPFLAAMPSDVTWSVCAFGGKEAACCATAMALGGHVRVGFENNLLLPDGQIAKGNADLVTGMTRIAALTGHRPATRAEALSLIGASQPEDTP